MRDPLAALEQSLRDGPLDERGYRPAHLEVPPGLRDDGPRRFLPVEQVVAVTSVRRAQVAPRWQYLAAVLVLAVGIAAFGIIRAPSQTGVDGSVSPPTGQASPSRSQEATSEPSVSPISVPLLTETFASPRHGFSVQYPAGWTVTPATAAWPPVSFLPYGNPALDTFESPAGNARLIVSSQALGIGQTEEAWLAAFFRPFEGTSACGADHSAWPRLPIGGTSGYLDAAGCPVPADSKISPRDVSFDALVFAGGRVYEFGLDGDVDLAYFEALLATVRLDPTKALD